jgi:O-glycosyl hydrolase
MYRKKMSWLHTLFLLQGMIHIMTACNSNALTVSTPLSNTTTAQPIIEASKVDPNSIYVENFEGWGTALAWGGVVVGGWPDQQRNDIADKLFSLEKGLGLNVIRYNIGGGPNPEGNGCGLMRPGGDVPGFLPGEDRWDWTADTNQRWFLQAAKERGANVFLAFSDSPPAWMTISGCTNGAEDGGNNLKPDHYGKFADYLATVVKHFRDEWGITFQALSPMNEPNSNWWKKSGRQEGCAFDHSSQVELINEVSRSLQEQGLVDVQIAGADTYDVKHLVSNWSSYPAETQSAVGILSTHVYAALPEAQVKLSKIAEESGRKIWMTEFGAGPGPYDLNSMAPSLELAQRILLDMKLMRPTVWIYWDGLESDEENHASNIMWGLITAKYLGDSYEYWQTKQYYAFGNYTRFIRPGAQFIDAGDKQTLAALSPDRKQLILIAYNSKNEDKSVAYDLRNFTLPDSVSVEVYHTSERENLERIENIPITDGQFTANLIGKSISTFVIALP